MFVASILFIVEIGNVMNFIEVEVKSLNRLTICVCMCIPLKKYIWYVHCMSTLQTVNIEQHLCHYDMVVFFTILW